MFEWLSHSSFSTFSAVSSFIRILLQSIFFMSKLLSFLKNRLSLSHTHIYKIRNVLSHERESRERIDEIRKVINKGGKVFVEGRKMSFEFMKRKGKWIFFLFAILFLVFNRSLSSSFPFINIKRNGKEGRRRFNFILLHH